MSFNCLDINYSHFILPRDLTEYERWRAAYDRLHQVSVLRPEHWLMRLHAEETLAHTDAAREQMVEMFKQATLDCYCETFIVVTTLVHIKHMDINYL